MAYFSRFLLIENPVKQPPSVELMRMLGASASRGNDERIGQFGSGFVYSLALLARHGLLEYLKVCLGTDVYTFYTEEHHVKDSQGNSVTQYEICMKKQNGGSWNLNISTDFGALDWDDVTMALREFLSNALDGNEAYDGTYSGVVIDPKIPVEGRKTRAQEGKIRIYLPMVDEFSDYIDNLYNEFICLRGTYEKDRHIINPPGEESLVTKVFRRGVKVGEIQTPSLFHYNLPDINVTESRVITSEDARTHVAKALSIYSTVSQIRRFLREVVKQENKDLFEYNLYISALRPSYYYYDDTNPEKIKAETRWREAVEAEFGGMVLSYGEFTDSLIRDRGLVPISVPEKFHKMLEKYGIQNAAQILSSLEIQGNRLSDPSPSLIKLFNEVWDWVYKMGFIPEGKAKPSLKVFTAEKAKENKFGYYDDNVCYINEVYVSEGASEILIRTLIEEEGHHITGFTDFTRDFQNFAFGLAAKAFLQQRRK